MVRVLVWSKTALKEKEIAYPISSRNVGKFLGNVKAGRRGAAKPGTVAATNIRKGERVPLVWIVTALHTLSLPHTVQAAKNFPCLIRFDFVAGMYEVNLSQGNGSPQAIPSELVDRNFQPECKRPLAQDRKEEEEDVEARSISAV